MKYFAFGLILVFTASIGLGQSELATETNKIYVFIVGVSDYSNDYWKKMSANLEDNIKEVSQGLYDELANKPYIEKVVLYDSINETTTSFLDNAISNELRQINEEGEPSVVLFFFIGHGKYVADEDFYIITSDTDDQIGKGSFGIMRDYMFHVNRFLKKSHVLTFIDACSSGEIENLREFRILEGHLKSNGVLHYMLTSTNDERPAFATTFSKTILRFIQDKSSNDNNFCYLSFSNSDATSALIPYTKKVYKEKGLPTEGLSQKQYIPISTFRTDKFCLDSFRGIKGCAVIGNNMQATLTFQIVDKNGAEITSGKLLAGRTFWFFGHLDTEYVVKCNWYDSFMKEPKTPEFKLKFTSKQPIQNHFILNTHEFGNDYADLLFESSQAARTIGVDEKIITATVAEANLIKRLANIRNNEGYATNNRIDNIMKNTTGQLALTTWSKENGEWYIFGQEGTKADFKQKVLELLAESRFKEASAIVHNNYLYSGEKEKLELSRNIELAYLAADATRKEDSIASFYEAENEVWDDVTENAMSRLSAFPEIENISGNTSKEILEKLINVQISATKNIVKWLGM